MKFDEYVNKRMAENGVTSRRAVLLAISKDAGVSYHTLNNVFNGYRISQYPVAKAIERATGGAVTVKELCE